MNDVFSKSDVVRVRIDHDTNKVIAKAAAKDGISVSEYIRKAVDRALNPTPVVQIKEIKVTENSATIADERICDVEHALKNVNETLKMLLDDREQMREHIAILMRRQEKQRVTDADMHDLVQKIGILVANYSKPLGLPKIFEPLVKELTQA